MSSIDVPSVSQAIITPSLYFIPRTVVPVTAGVLWIGEGGGGGGGGGGTVSGGRKERSDAQISNLAKREHDDVTVASMCPFHSCRSRSIGG